VKEITINGTNHTVEYTGEDVPGEDLEFMGKRRGNIRGWRNNFFVEIPTGQSRYGDRRGAAVNPNCEQVLREKGARDEEVRDVGMAGRRRRPHHQELRAGSPRGRGEG
jgi:hypothetical protein